MKILEQLPKLEISERSVTRRPDGKIRTARARDFSQSDSRISIAEKREKNDIFSLLPGLAAVHFIPDKISIVFIIRISPVRPEDIYKRM